MKEICKFTRNIASPLLRSKLREVRWSQILDQISVLIQAHLMKKVLGIQIIREKEMRSMKIK